MAMGYLLLNGRDGVNADAGVKPPILLQQPERFGDDEAAHLVVGE